MVINLFMGRMVDPNVIFIATSKTSEMSFIALKLYRVIERILSKAATRVLPASESKYVSTSELGEQYMRLNDTTEFLPAGTYAGGCVGGAGLGDEVEEEFGGGDGRNIGGCGDFRLDDGGDLGSAPGVVLFEGGSAMGGSGGNSDSCGEVVSAVIRRILVPAVIRRMCEDKT